MSDYVSVIVLAGPEKYPDLRTEPPCHQWADAFVPDLMSVELGLVVPGSKGAVVVGREADRLGNPALILRAKTNILGQPPRGGKGGGTRKEVMDS